MRRLIDLILETFRQYLTKRLDINSPSKVWQFEGIVFDESWGKDVRNFD